MVAAGAAAIGSAAYSPDASAQVGFMCSYGTTGNPYPSLIPDNGIATQQVLAIAQAIGFEAPIQVLTTPDNSINAQAVPLTSAYGTVPGIIYSYDFLNRLYFAGGQWAPVSVLAHEVGHHADGDTTWLYHTRVPWQRELGADWVSGFALARMGAALEDAQRAQGVSYQLFGYAAISGSETHPPAHMRMRAINEGWSRGISG